MARLGKLSDAEKEALGFCWEFWARPKQLPPRASWRVWLILAGRGFGKTRTGAEWVRAQARKYDLVNLIAPTADDARDILIEGESGILRICPRGERPQYLPSKRRLEWPNGGRSHIFTADEPERLRGKQHKKVWCDELASWRYPEAWTQAMFGLRLGDNPQAVVTTTPKPTKLVRDLVAAPTTAVTRGTTYENRRNLAEAFYEEIISVYEGTRLGRQELNAEILEDNPGALWQLEQIEDLRVKQPPDLRRVVVAIDPAVTASEESDETGILVAGVGHDGHGYILEDGSGRFTPNGWANRAIALYQKWGADRIVAEVNNGGDLVEVNVRTVDKLASYKAVHASRGKVIRAEPVAALYEQGRVHHVGNHAGLEDQMTSWDHTYGDRSPDRVDALVWAITELMLGDNWIQSWIAV